jgi:plasmid maintenance system antidote protein VapI
VSIELYLQVRSQARDLVRPAIVEAMRRRSMTTSALAKRSGVGDGRIASFLAGRSEITTATLSRLMSALHLELV